MPLDTTKHPLRSKTALCGELLVRARKMWTEIREAAAQAKPWATDVDGKDWCQGQASLPSEQQAYRSRLTFHQRVHTYEIA